jgi:monoamine oxidase
MSPSRRDVLKLGALAVAAPFVPLAASPKRVIVAGAGIGGLSCAWELVRRGHDVVVLEAAARTGGHVYTVRDGLDEGLYADGGAEHFTQPGYERFWSYVREFELPHLYYPRRERVLRWIDGRMYTDEQLRDRAVLGPMGFNAREIAFIAAHGWPELLALYFRPYVDAFPDEYRPFDAKLDHLDALTLDQLLERDGASAATRRLFGGRSSALQAVWHAAILAHRGVPLWPSKVYRLVGGNQSLPDAFAARLGSRIRLESPLRRIEHSASGVRVSCGGTDAGGWTTLEADHLVCAMSAIMLSRVAVEPAWPPEKAYAITNVPYYFDTRVILQSKSRFWQAEGISPNMEFGDPALDHSWTSADEVQTTKGLVLGTGGGAVSAEAALAAFRRHYPGRREDVERAQVVVWATDPWASACERTSYAPGELRKFWPTLIEPHGRIHFVGAYADNLNWGMEAATRSAYRVAEHIHAG